MTRRACWRSRRGQGRAELCRSTERSAASGQCTSLARRVVGGPWTRGGGALGRLGGARRGVGEAEDAPENTGHG